MSNEWIYLCQRVMMPIESLNEGEPLAVRIYCYHLDHLHFEAVLDWQNGLTIFQSENIEPSEWSNLSACILEAMKEARQMIGSQWDSHMPDPN